MGDREPVDEVLDRLEGRALRHLAAYGSCAQSTLLALIEEFGLGNPEVLRAATAMPGVALRGETCGAVIGPVMALGLAFGREKPEELEAFQRTLRAAHRFCRQFEGEMGSCMCRDIQERIFGRSYDLTDLDEASRFAEDGAAEKCGTPVGTAVRIAGRIILEGINPADET